MKLFNFLLGLFTALTFVACGGDDGGSGSTAAATPETTAENIVVLSRGSGEACPDISGTYSCTEVQDQNNSASELATYNVFTNSQGQQIFRQDSMNLIMDGELHDIPGGQLVAALGGKSPQYVFDCNGDTITFHMVSDENNASKIVFTKTGENSLNGTTHELLEGKLNVATGACSKATAQEINEQPSTPEETGFNIFTFLWDLIF